MKQQDFLTESLPRKKVKRFYQSAENMTQQEKAVFCKCYSQKQINDIQSAIVGIKQYTKYISIMIRHQEKSIATIPKHIIQMGQFRQLKQRVNKCIQRARFNNQFLQKIGKNYSEHLHSVLKGQNFENKSNQITPNSVIYIFLQIIKEWSSFSMSNMAPIYQVIELIKKYSIHELDPFYATQGPCVFVQGAGMGRLLCEIEQNLKPKPRIIEGCQDRALHYLCGQYFLQNYKKKDKKDKIYPFIHDFRNKYKASQVYQQFWIPEWPYQLKQSKRKEQIYFNLGNFEQNYSSKQYNQQWDILVSYLCNDRVTNILRWIQISYKGLKQKGLWIIVCYSSFERNIIAITYKQFMQVIEKTQFKVINEYTKQEEIISDRGMTKQRLKIHYMVLEK